MRLNGKVFSIVLVLMMIFSTFMTAPAYAKGGSIDPGSNSVVPANIAQLVPYMSMSKDGLFVLDQKSIPGSLKTSKDAIKQIQGEFSAINAHLQEFSPSERPHVVKDAKGVIHIQFSGDTHPSKRWCVYIGNWVYDFIGWVAIVYGGGVATAGLFAGGTVIGLPLGSVLGAIGLWQGISGSYIIWYADKYYPNGKTTCFG